MNTKNVNVFENNKFETIVGEATLVSVNEDRITIKMGDAEEQVLTKRSDGNFVLVGKKIGAGIAVKAEEAVLEKEPEAPKAVAKSSEGTGTKAKKEDNKEGKTPSKADRCRTMVATMHAAGASRKEMIECIMTDLGMKQVAASTYYYNAMKALNLENVGRKPKETAAANETKKEDVTPETKTEEPSDDEIASKMAEADNEGEITHHDEDEPDNVAELDQEEAAA